MDYKHEYEEMVRRCKELHESGNALTKKQMEIVCPSLADSEDERIRKDIIVYLSNELHNVKQLTPRTNEFEAWIAWLEKKKIPEGSPTPDLTTMLVPNRYNEHKSAEWSDEDKDYYDAIIAKLEVTQDDAMLTDNQIDFLKSIPERFYLQPKQEWSEEDVEKLAKNRANKSGTLKSEMIFYRQGVRDAFNYKGMHPAWKPSEEQVEALNDCVRKARDIHNASMGGYDVYPKLQSLLQNLEKL